MMPVQQTGSPYSDTVQLNSGDYSCPVEDLVHHSNFNHLHSSYSDSVLPPYGQVTCEPLHLVPRESTIAGTNVPDHTMIETLPTAHSGKSVNNKKWTNPEMLLDCDNQVENNVAEDNNDIASIGKCVEQNSFVVDQTNEDNYSKDSDTSGCSAAIEMESSCNDKDKKIVDISDNMTLTSDSTPATEDSNDIVFLKNCFPNVSSEHIQQVYNSSDSMLDRAVNTLLQLPTTPVKTTSGWLDICQFVDSLQEQSSHDVEESSSAPADHDVSADDEKIARALQEQFDREMVEGKSVSAEVVSEDVENLGEPHPPDRSSTHTPAAQPVCADSDEGLILRLSPSLASTLQNMFGSVQKHLVNEGI